MATIEFRIAALEARARRAQRGVVLPDEEAMRGMSDEALQALYDDVILNGKPHQLPDLEKLSDEAFNRLERIAKETERKDYARQGLPPPLDDEDPAAACPSQSQPKAQTIRQRVEDMPRETYYHQMAALAALTAFERRSRWAVVSAKQAAEESPDWSGYTDAELIHIYMCEGSPEFYGQQPPRAGGQVAAVNRSD